MIRAVKSPTDASGAATPLLAVSLSLVVSVPLSSVTGGWPARVPADNVIGVARSEPARLGPLRVHGQNRRYFMDGTGRAVLLVGSHTWNNLVDMGPSDPPPRFDFDQYLNWLAAQNHNFIRLWTWELTRWDTRANRDPAARVQFVWPQPWARTGPGVALDGKLKFDLQQFNEEYFWRLRRRVAAAQQRGNAMVELGFAHDVSVMLFEGWGLQFCPDAWSCHPFNKANNINGIDGDLDGDGKGLQIHTGRSKQITELQRAYVRKVIDTVNDFDNVLYEISNENHPPSTQWQYDMIRFIKRYEGTKGKQHPVGMTFQYRGGSNRSLFASPADWISPNPEGGYRDNPPAADGSKVIITDTDHLWGIGGNAAWVWKSFLRGLNPIFMDPYRGTVLSKRFDLKWIKPIRRSMGDARRWSLRVDLAAMAPHAELASSRYCLANPGKELLVYLPAGQKRLSVNLPAGRYKATWFDPASGREQRPKRFEHAGGTCELASPYAADAVLHIVRATGAGPN